MKHNQSRDSDGSSDESIGRPAPWREGRYQQPGKSVDDSVSSSTEPPRNEPAGVPVTREDYETKVTP